MPIEIEERSVTRETLAEYGRMSIAFEVRSLLDVAGAGLDGIRLAERTLDRPWTKDYDAIRGEGPTRWIRRFDVSRWGLLVAREGPAAIGGAVIAWRSPDVEMLRGRDDLAVLWDLRVVPERRGRGVGTRLFEAAVAWARDRGCRDLEVETQNVNVPACRFYAARGCTLAVISRLAYPEFPDEILMLWRRPLA